MLHSYESVLRFIALTCKVITGVALVVLTVIFGWLVYGRYILNSTPTWVEQAALLLVMVIAFIGSAVGVHEKTHLSVNVLRDAVSAQVRTVLFGVSHILMLGFGGFMCWYGYKLTVFKWASSIPLIQLPEGLRSLPLTIAGALIALFSIGHLWRLFVSPSKT